MTYCPPMISATDAAVVERAYRLANRAMFTIALQVGRLDSLEPADEIFVFGKHADLESSRVAKCRGLSPVLRYAWHRAT